ncbi:hypothetical protein E2542_SST27582 [Spatholobus suberectus]|nr:hypothetical protein E2542_SST27582 [Spatholobus suberectus]
MTRILLLREEMSVAHHVGWLADFCLARWILVIQDERRGGEPRCVFGGLVLLGFDHPSFGLRLVRNKFYFLSFMLWVLDGIISIHLIFVVMSILRLNMAISALLRVQDLAQNCGL